MRNVRSAFSFAAGALLVFSAVGIPADTGLARVYAGHAADMYGAGAYDRALELAETALRIRPDLSDALHLKSLVLGRERGTRREALDAARAAAAGGSWERFSPRDGALREAGLLTLTRSYDEALRILEGLRPRSADADHLRLLCRRGLGDVSGAAAEMDSALLAYPGDPRFLRAAFILKDPLDPGVSRLFRLMDRKNPANLPAFSVYIQRVASPEAAPALAEEYFAAGGADPAVSCLLLESVPEKRNGELARFAALGGFSRMDLIRRAAEIGDESFRGELSRRLAGFDGPSVIDADGDGEPEERFVLRKGAVASWAVDANQDGRDETTIGFTDGGLPAGFALGAGEIAGEYWIYPYLRRLSASGGEKRSVWHFSLGAFSAPVLPSLPAPEGGLPAAHPYAANSPLFPSLIAEAPSRAHLIEESGRKEGETRRFTVRDGRPAILEIAAAAAAGGEKVVRRVLFDRGVPVSGERDTDGDGRFEIREIFDGGALAAVEFDAGGYRETFLPSAFKEWDMNHDGRIDAREYGLGGGRVRREYASAFNGVFDTAADDLLPRGVGP